ncbi:MAG: hypothetical protein IJ201_00255 [Solobacterium sp.]|nr:hypothetical protein [Solobacterium sp.]
MSEYVSKEELKEFFEGIEITVAGRTRAEAISEVLQAIYNGVMKLPTTDAVPSETLYDFIRGIGAITYGKERFFHEEIGVHCGLWYDRKTCEWITTQTAIEECLEAVREFDDGDIDAEPMRHGKWMGTVCTACGESTSFYYDCDYCPHCGARMDADE